MLKIIDRYILRELVTPFLIGLSVFTFLLLIDKIFDLVDLIINKGVPVHQVLLLLAYILPAFLVLTIPIRSRTGGTGSGRAEATSGPIPSPSSGPTASSCPHPT